MPSDVHTVYSTINKNVNKLIDKRITLTTSTIWLVVSGHLKAGAIVLPYWTGWSTGLPGLG